MEKYFYKNLAIVPYWNGYRVYYLHENGNRELVAFQMTKKDAIKAGHLQVDYMNNEEVTR